jgi:histidyl-tRNA synthetase
MSRVLDELIEKGLSESNAEKLKAILSISGDFQSVIKDLGQHLGNINSFQSATEDINKVLELLNIDKESYANLELDPTLARGLSYYTGCIFEVKVNNVSIGSVSGGGRYDNLTGIFGQPGLSGIGISFGVDRIYDVLEELDLFPQTVNHSSDLLFCHFDSTGLKTAQQLATRLREVGISTEVYPDTSKMKKQMSYANRKAVPHVGIIGETEIQNGTIMLKNLSTGDQKELTIEQCIEELRK